MKTIVHGDAGVAAAADLPVEKKPRPRKLKGSVCYATAVEIFDAGKKKLDVTITPTGVWLHGARKTERYFLPWDVAYTKAVAIEANASIDPRGGRDIKRGGAR